MDTKEFSGLWVRNFYNFWNFVFAVTAFAGEWSTRYNGHTRKQDWIRGDDPVFSGTLTTGSLLIGGTLPDDLYVNITGDTMTGQLQATTLTDGTLIITNGDLTTTEMFLVRCYSKRKC